MAMNKIEFLMFWFIHQSMMNQSQLARARAEDAASLSDARQ
jgi:hypothetical protein